jgi:hypothetical protein
MSIDGIGTRSSLKYNQTSSITPIICNDIFSEHFSLIRFPTFYHISNTNHTPSADAKSFGMFFVFMTLSHFYLQHRFDVFNCLHTITIEYREVS